MNAKPRMPATPPSIAAQITQLPELPMPEIKAIWRRLFGDDAPTHNRQFLERRIAYKLQEIAFRKSNPALLDRNKRRIEALLETGKSRKREQDFRPIPGTVLMREHHGVQHRVVVTQDGQYDYEGRLYGSLSVIAREITGTRWSGPLFFGLKAPSKTKKQGSR